jgi:dihydrofolate synthase/folylpolyglutamate synthase
VTYETFLKNLNARGMFRIHPSLDRVRRVLNVLGHPQDRIPAIHIAGTNGKGSVAAGLESVLRASGYRTGLYTSPHLIDLRERVKIDGSALLEGFVLIALQVLAAENKAKAPLTYFELLTAIAFQAFAAKKVDIAIIECGLGGLWDATNVLKQPLVSVITSIGLDHTEWLGKTETQIASQKAGIIKERGCVISGVRGPGRGVIARTAREKGAKIYQIDTDFKGESLASSWQTGKQTISFLYNGQPVQIVPFGLLGTHQADNAAIIMATLRQLSEFGWAIPPANRDRGLRDIYWPGRLQVVRSHKSAPILLDGAHNPSAMNLLLHNLESSVFKNVPKTFVFSAFKDKNFKTMGAMIQRLAAEVCLCPLPGPRGAAVSRLSPAFSRVRGPVRVFKSSHEALVSALRDTPRDGLVVVTGSLALVGGILKAVTPADCKPGSSVVDFKASGSELTTCRDDDKRKHSHV